MHNSIWKDTFKSENNSHQQMKMENNSGIGKTSISSIKKDQRKGNYPQKMQKVT